MTKITNKIVLVIRTLHIRICLGFGIWDLEFKILSPN